jgi:hypothetical protein
MTSSRLQACCAHYLDNRVLRRRSLVVRTSIQMIAAACNEPKASRYSSVAAQNLMVLDQQSGANQLL